MILADRITKWYPTKDGRHYVFRNVSFEIPSCAQVGVIGRNGAGKSTLLKLMAGVDVPDRGRIVREGSVSWPIGIANCVQPLMTGVENTRFACRIQGMHYDDMAPIIDFVQSFAELGKFFDMPVRVYSSGMKARLTFAITMAFDFDVYIIDELTAVGDQTFKTKAYNMFQERRKKASFIKASHSFRELRAECDSGLVLHDGRAEYWPSIDQAVERYLSLIEPSRKPGAQAGKAAAKWRRSRRQEPSGKIVEAVDLSAPSPAAPPVAAEAGAPVATQQISADDPTTGRDRPPLLRQSAAVAPQPNPPARRLDKLLSRLRKPHRRS